jgi:acyl-CoA thioesterase I
MFSATRHWRRGAARGVMAVLFALLTAAASGCSREPARSVEDRAPAAAAPSAGAPNEASRPKIVALGDSLTAGYGLLEAQSYPALLQDKLNEDGYNWEVVNAGISGDTTAAGLQRLDWTLQEPDVRILILELGANDGLRGLSVSEMRKNLSAIIEHAQQKRIAVLLAGMEAPPNYGPEYAASFRQVYRDLAREYHVTLIPFMLTGVAGIGSLNQSDGIHPNIEGTRIVAETLWTALRPMVDAAGGS